MTLVKGDHLVIMRNGTIILSEGHAEYEVMEDPRYSTVNPADPTDAYTAVSVGPLKVVS